MTLLPCTGLWGKATLIASDPVASVVRDAVFLPPHHTVFLDSYPGWGLFDADGGLIGEAAYCRMPDHRLVGQSRQIAAIPALEALPPGDYVYGGAVIMHFGHFLTTGLARLWPLVRGGLPPGARIVVHAHQTPEQWFAHDYIRTIFGALGLGPERFLALREPVRIRRILVPGPAFEEQNYVHRVFRELCRRIGRAICPGIPDPSGPVYLSKSRTRFGTARLLNEEPLEAQMAARGVEVVFPETLGFAEQVRRIGSAAAVLGTVGSALHASLLCPAPRRIVGLAYGAEINANFELIDRLMGNDARYVYDPGVCEAAAEDSTFAYRAADPAGIADGLYELYAGRCT